VQIFFTSKSSCKGGSECGDKKAEIGEKNDGGARNEERQQKGQNERLKRVKSCILATDVNEGHITEESGGGGWGIDGGEGKGDYGGGLFWSKLRFFLARQLQREKKKKNWQKDLSDQGVGRGKNGGVCLVEQKGGPAKKRGRRN